MNNINIFELDVSYISNNYSSLDIFMVGLTNAFALSLPLSAPLLICLRRLLIEGIPSGLVCYLGTALGQTFFISLLLFGFRDIIQLWYDWEPLLYLIGVYLSCTILFEFFTDPRLKPVTPVTAKTLSIIAFQNFLLVFLNPANAMNTSQVVMTEEVLGLSAANLYLVSLLIGTFGFSCIFGFIFYLLRNWFLTISVQPYRTFMRPINKGIVIFTLSLILNVTAKYTWQLFLQHPAESFLNNIGGVEKFLPGEVLATNSIREFPAFDSNIKNRERYLPVHRHFPLDSIKQRRSWMNKPPLTESQFETIYFRYNIHIVNKISDWVTQTRFKLRTPFSEKTTPQQIQRLKQLQSEYLAVKSKLGNDSASGRPIQNMGKGSPPFSYSKPTPEDFRISDPKQLDSSKNPEVVDLSNLLKINQLDKDRDFFLCSNYQNCSFSKN